MKRVDLKEKVVHLIRTVEDLSDLVAAQALETTGLERRVRHLMDHAVEKEAIAGQPEADVRPPHW